MMKKINNNKLKELNGGGVDIGVIIVVSAIVSFISGVVAGIANPAPCNK